MGVSCGGLVVFGVCTSDELLRHAFASRFVRLLAAPVSVGGGREPLVGPAVKGAVQPVWWGVHLQFSEMMIGCGAFMDRLARDAIGD
jgi:hypothetical protein